MLERYKTLGAMLALGEFSISEVAILSGVREPSVRTILRREDAYAEQIGTQPSGRRGGQPRRWRVRPEARERLRNELKELERLGAGPWIGASEQGHTPVPEALIAAQNVLLREVPAAADPAERSDLVKLAEAQLEIAAAASPAAAGTGEADNELAHHHRRIAELLIELEQAERPTGKQRRSQTTSAVPRLVMDLLLTAGKVDDIPLAEAVKRRLEASPVPWFGVAASQASPASPACAAIGMELLPHQLMAVLVDDHGKRLDCRPLTLEDMDIETVVSGAVKLTALLARSIPEGASERVALGFQLGGPVETETGTVLFYRKSPPKPPSRVRPVYWRDHQPLGRLLQESTGLPTVVENDANAFAVYQQWFGVGRNTSRFAVVLVREGVGGSLVINNRLFDGPMEIGNLSVLPEKVKRPCDCGSMGCLETTGGIYGILEAVQEYTSESNEVLDDLEAASSLAGSPDNNGAEEPFRLAGEANAKGIGIIVNFARPKRVVLYAPRTMTDTSYASARVFRAGVETFRNYCHGSAFGDCELIIETLRPYVGAHGAALLALERCFGITADIALAGKEAAPALVKERRLPVSSLGICLR